ncbi:MAG: hypothetical protein M1828_002675 [Chrysothrix sp. TS-e1954]|nr:MAG: hypothetical protein M1828_002675 [Chrysothrix sp. TS-e1954]
MDKIKEMAGKMGGGSSSSGSSSGNAAGSSGKEDYVDKGMDFAENKAGMKQSRETNEKISDAGRNFYEKQTGSNVSDKVSN